MIQADKVFLVLWTLFFQEKLHKKSNLTCSSNVYSPICEKVYWLQLYEIRFVIDLQRVSDFLWV